jgi:hypothetical protein
MPVIKARTRRIPMVRHVCRLTVSNRDVLVAYARMIGDTPDYVANRLIERTLSPDPDFRKWWAQEATAAATPPETREATKGVTPGRS